MTVSSRCGQIKASRFNTHHPNPHQIPASKALTAQFDANEVFNAQVFQEHPERSSGLKKEGDVGTQLSVEGWEVEVWRLLVEESCIPEVPCETWLGLLNWSHTKTNRTDISEKGVHCFFDNHFWFNQTSDAVIVIKKERTFYSLIN